MHTTFLAVCLFLFFAQLVSCGSVLNLTKFWQTQLNKTEPLGYQAFAGYEPVNWFNDGKLFYTLWSKYNTSIQDTSVPLVIFLAGGPGSASQGGPFNKNGPIRVIGHGDDIHVQQSMFGWNQYCHLLAVDQPINTGFSFDSNHTILSTSQQAGAHFVNFLYNFFETWGGKDRPVYLTGESYGGHWVPVFTELLLSNRSLGFNIKGITVWGPFINSYVQDNQLDAFLESQGITDREATEVTQQRLVTGMMLMKQGKLAQGTQVMNSIYQNDDFVQQYFGGVNILNVRQYDDGNINTEYGKYLNKIKDDLGVPKGISFRPSNPQIYGNFSYDLGQSKEKSLLYCMDRIKVMLVAGQHDGVCSPPGIITLVNSLNWKFKPQWQRQIKQIMRLGDEVLGWTKKYGRFTLALVNGAGHLVTADQPRAFRYLFMDWLSS